MPVNKDIYFLNNPDGGEPERKDTGEMTPAENLNRIVNAAVEDYAEQVGLDGNLFVSLIIDDEEMNAAKNQAKYSLADLGEMVAYVSNEKAYYVVSLLNDIIPRISILMQATMRSYSNNNIHREHYMTRLKNIEQLAQQTRMFAMRMTDAINELAFTSTHQFNYENDIHNGYEGFEDFETGDGGEGDDPHGGIV